MSGRRYPKVGVRLGFSGLLVALATGFIFGQEMPAGLAAKYPGDAGIDKDPAVIFVEDFEEGSFEAVATRWETVRKPEAMSLASEVPEASGGEASLLMTHVGGRGNAIDLYRRLANDEGGYGYNQVYARFYVKFAPDCAPVHHFGTNIGGNNPATRYPDVSAGNRTQGDKSFWVGVEPGGNRWTWDYYTYWMEMRGSPPSGRTWGNSFIRNPELKVTKGRWQCVEVMVKVNDVGETNGEMACWIDGEKVSHLGKGFPKGLWTFDKFTPGKGGQGVRWDDSQGKAVNFQVPAAGAPFEGFQWRTVEELKVNYVWVYLYLTKADEGHVSKIWFDDVVVATEYIGPVASAR